MNEIDRRSADMAAKSPAAEIPAGLHQALTRVHAANVAMGQGDPEPYMRLWSRADEVTVFGAWGPCRRGWDELSQAFRWVGSRFGGGELRSEEVAVTVSGELAYTVGYERGAMVVDGGAPQPMTIRVTHIFRNEDGEWRLVHRHGDFAPLDQSAGKLT
jgi:ketosteroid isomerase-like protein